MVSLLPVPAVHDNSVPLPSTGATSDTSIGHSVERPQERNHHAATHLSGPLFVVVGGEYQPFRTLNDMWLCDTTTKLWKKVLFLVTSTFLCVHKQPIIF